MRTIAEHTDAALALARPRVKSLSLVHATGLTLATPVAARLPVPPFANSAMDGFAVHSADLAGAADGAGAGGAGWRLPIAGDIPAGAAAVECPPGHAVRVMTGAPVPPGHDITVIPVEQTDIPAGPVPLPDAVTIRRFDPARRHVRAAGCDVCAGDVVAEPGTVLDAAALAALVATGVREVEVFAAPRVAVISTGDELVAWPGDISGAQIPNSNLPMLAEISRAAGAGVVTAFQAGDTDAGGAAAGCTGTAGATGGFAEAFNRAAADADLVVTSGGVSAGAFDVVRATTQEAGGMWFGHVAQRPGGPQGIGTYQGTPLLCLPGNPVAAFVSAHLYLVPLIRAFAGYTRGLRAHERPRFAAEVGSGFPAPLPGRSLVVPARLDFAGPRPYATAAFAGTGSHRVASLAGVDGLVILPPAGDAPAEPAVLAEPAALAGAPRTVSVLPTRL